MILTKDEAACFIYGLEISAENASLSLKKLEEVDLEPVTFVNGDQATPFAMSTKKINMEPWRYNRFPATVSSRGNSDENSIHESQSSESYIMSIAPSQSSVIELMKMIMPPQPIPGITEPMFLCEDNIYDLVSSYIPESTITKDKLWHWMSKNGSWGMVHRRQSNKRRKCGRDVNLVMEKYRDFTWDDISNIHQYRSFVRSTASRVCTVGYVRKSRTREPKKAKIKSIDLQIYKLKTKLLCEHVFASYNTNASDPISARDANSKPSSIPQFQDSSGTMQDMMETITKSPKKIRLVVIDYAGLTTDPDDLKWFMQANKQIEEVVVDIGHKVEIYSRKDLKKESILQKFNCRTSCVKRSKQ